MFVCFNCTPLPAVSSPPQSQSLSHIQCKSLLCCDLCWEIDLSRPWKLSTVPVWCPAVFTLTEGDQIQLNWALSPAVPPQKWLHRRKMG